MAVAVRPAGCAARDGSAVAEASAMPGADVGARRAKNGGIVPLHVPLYARTLLALCLVVVCSLSSFGLASADEQRFEPSSRGTRSERSVGGVATWYGQDFQGSPMADGTPYDM